MTIYVLLIKHYSQKKKGSSQKESPSLVCTRTEKKELRKTISSKAPPIETSSELVLHSMTELRNPQEIITTIIHTLEELQGKKKNVDTSIAVLAQWLHDLM